MPPIRNQNIPPPRPPLQTRRDNVRHPSNSYGEPYSQDLRQLVLSIRQAGHGDHPIINQLRLQHDYPCQDTENRWDELHRRLGHYRACRRTGNSWATVLRGQDLVLLSLYRIVFPKANAPEINAFLYRANYGNPDFRFYSHSQISTAKARIGLSRKAGSTTAYQALLPINIYKRWCFYHLPYPMGIADVPRRLMIDLDECGIFVESANRKHGKSYIGCRVKEPGPYSKSEKWNLLLAISGERAVPGRPSPRWRKIWLDGGTTVDKMIEFITEILTDLGPATPNNRRCFTMDNLTAHHNHAVTALIYESGHRLVFRAPYYAVDGPIEYSFNTLQCMLRTRLHKITDGATLVNEIGNVIQAMVDFDPYFVHCGFWRN